MDSGWAALRGTVIGGALSLAGSAGITRFQANREDERLERHRRHEDERVARERLREKLYALQDAIDPVFRAYSSEIFARWRRHEDVSGPNPEMRAAVFRARMLSVRVGDEVLAAPLSALLQHLETSRHAPSWDETVRAYGAAQERVGPILERIGELLHTETKVDLGV